MIRRAALCLFLISWGPLAARSDADAARDAMTASDMLAQAEQALDRATSARNRVEALTAVIQAHEAGLAAMRDGLRGVTLREQQLAREFEAREEEISHLLGALLSVSRIEGPAVLLHPSGPTGTARAGILLSELAPALKRGSSALRASLDEYHDLREVQEQAMAALQAGLENVQQARAQLSQAVADRTDLPRRFSEDPVKREILLASAETLDGFANGLRKITVAEVPGTLPSIGDLKGRLPLPAPGIVLRQAGEADAAGIIRPGLLLATQPRVLVATPTAATLRYRGPLLDYGLVAILEPQADTLFVFAGLGTVFGEPGQVLPAGSPVGLMGGSDPDLSTNASTVGDGAGIRRSETLYIEVREGNFPVNPMTWFAADED